MNWEWKTDLAFANASFCLGWYFPDWIYVFWLLAVIGAQFSKPRMFSWEIPDGVWGVYLDAMRSDWPSIVFWCVCLWIGVPLFLFLVGP